VRPGAWNLDLCCRVFWGLTGEVSQKELLRQSQRSAGHLGEKHLKNIRSGLRILLCAAVCFGLLITGCGGGGGDSSSTLDPEQLEVAAVVDRFSAAVRAEDADAANACLDTNLKYRRVGNINEVGSDKFIARLKTFFAGAAVKDFQIANIGIQVADDQAVGRADMSLVYTDGNGVEQAPISENIELEFERTGNIWGLLKFGVYSEKGSAFPPEL